MPVAKGKAVEIYSLLFTYLGADMKVPKILLFEISAGKVCLSSTCSQNLVILPIFFFLLLSQNALSQPSRGYLQQSLYSNILDKEMRYSIYLPADYESSQKMYPVLYLLHGGEGDESSWMIQGDLKEIADNYISGSQERELIIVMPDAEMTYYMNNVNGEYQYEDYFINEFIPFIESKYRILDEKKYRSIAGASMGGFGALLYSIHHPEMFSTCATLSAAIRTDDQINNMGLEHYLRRYKTAMGNVKEGEERITEFWKQNSILHLVPQIPEEQKNSVRFYLDVGDGDYLFKGNSLTHITMHDNEIPHEYRVRDGFHTWDYWKEGLPAILEYIGQGYTESITQLK